MVGKPSTRMPGSNVVLFGNSHDYLDFILKEPLSNGLVPDIDLIRAIISNMIFVRVSSKPTFELERTIKDHGLQLVGSKTKDYGGGCFCELLITDIDEKRRCIRNTVHLFLVENTDVTFRSAHHILDNIAPAFHGEAIERALSVRLLFEATNICARN